MSNDRNSKLHFAIWQKKLLPLNFVSFKSIWKPNPCMDLLEKKILLYQNLLYFLQGKSFSPWMASIGHPWQVLICLLRKGLNHLNIDLRKPFTVKRTCPAKTRIKTDLTEKKIQEDSSMDLPSRMIWRFGHLMKLDPSSFSVKSQSVA